MSKRLVTSQTGEFFRRHRGNPIITVGDLPYPANSVFNAGVARVDDETLLLMRVEDRRGISHLTIARSADGVSDWQIGELPALTPAAETHPEETWGIEDPRITRLEELSQWAIVYTAYSREGPMISLATTRDFARFERKGPLFTPENKDGALFPERIDGRWAMIHRPASAYRATRRHIWISFSPDLLHWGDHRILIPARKGPWWDANKVGLSTPPLQTDEGWLILYHGIKATISGAIYRLGLALLDLNDPGCVLARSDEWVFSPEDDYEVLGDVDKVVFPCGWLARGDEVTLYYGGADKCLGMATASLTELLNSLRPAGGP